MRSLTPGNGHVFWQEQGVTPPFHRSRRIDLVPTADGEYRDYEIAIAPQIPVVAVRLDPTERPGTVIVDSMQLVDATGKILQSWEFDDQ